MEHLPTDPNLKLEDFLEVLDVGIHLRSDVVYVALDYFSLKDPMISDTFEAEFTWEEFASISTYLDLIKIAIEKGTYLNINDENEDDYDESF